MKDNTMKYLFEPRSVAIIGASAHKEKIGYMLLSNMMSGKFKGKIYPVNPSGGTICGLKAYKSVDEIPGGVDLATIAIPSNFVLDAIKQCGKKGVKFASIITSGFSEVGNIEEENIIVEQARASGMRILGPNIFGIFSAKSSLNATFGPSDIKKGHVAIVTQSGALGIAMIGKTKVENLGLSAIVSVGNKADIQEADLLEYLVNDDTTGVILMYVEGIKDGQRLVGVLKEATRKKPVIVIKSGRSKRGAVAAASHTGSLAGADEIFSAVMRQCGVNRAENIQEALDWCKFLSNSCAPKGENTVIITNGGGIGVLAADACEKFGVELYDDAVRMKKIFGDVVPSFGTTKNPVDITGQARFGEYQKALAAAIEDDKIHSIICLGCETAALDPDSLSKTLMRLFADGKNKKPYALSFFGGEDIEKQTAILRKKDINIYSDVYQAASCMGALYLNYRNKKRPCDDEHAAITVDHEMIAKAVKSARADGRTFLLSNEARQTMTAANMRIPKGAFAKDMIQAASAAREIGYPVVMKVVSKDIIHKSDAGGVALGLDDEREVVDAYQAIMHRCKAYNPRAKIDGVEISQMVAPGTETIIGARIDPSFGPVIMFGLGGVYVEVMKDVSFRALPIGRTQAYEMIKDIKSYPLLLGVRGEEAKDIDSIVDVILKVGAIIESNDEISDIEVNPLVVYSQGEGACALDARILLKLSDRSKSVAGQRMKEEG